MDLRRQLERVVRELDRAGIDFALIGGLALAPHGAGRGTQDLDLLADGARSADIDRIMQDLGFGVRHRTEDVGNYTSEDPAQGRVDVLFARRPPSHAMLERARPFTVLGSLEVRVVDAADLIGLKVQSSSNNPARRYADMADIERLLRLASGVDLERVREYFRLFDREKELDALLAELGLE